MYSLGGRRRDLLTRFDSMDFCWLPKFWTLPSEVSDPNDAGVCRTWNRGGGRRKCWGWKREHRQYPGRNGGDDKLTWNEASRQQKMTWPRVRDSKHAEFHQLSWCGLKPRNQLKSSQMGEKFGLKPPDVTWCRCLAEPGLAWDNVEIFPTAPCEFGQSNVWCFRAPLIRWHFW